MIRHVVFKKINPVYYLVFTFLFSGFIFQSIQAQQNELTDSVSEDPDYLVGLVKRIDLQKDDFGVHFLKEYQAYEPRQENLIQLGHHIFDYTIVVVLGTWCHDSQEQVPRFYKILDEMHYKTTLVSNICVDKNKEAEGTNVADLSIERVPTFIFYKNGKEVGRIIETPNISLEEDSFTIVSGQ